MDPPAAADPVARAGPQTTARRLRGPRSRIVATLAVTETVSWGVLYYAFAVFVVPMEAELGLSRAQLSGAYAVALLASGAAAPAVGAWIDRHGGRGVMTSGSVAATLLVLAWSQVDGAAGLYAVQAALGIAMAATLYEPAFAVLATWFDDDRPRAVLAVTVVAGFASTVFLPLAQALITGLGWRSALVVLAVVLGVLTIPLHMLLPSRSPEDRRPAYQPAPTRRALLRDAAFWRLAATFVLGTASVVAVSTHLPALLVERGQTAAFAATVTGLLGVLSVAGRLALAAGGRRWRLDALLAAVLAVQAAALVMLAVAGGQLVVVAFVLAYGLGFGVLTIARPLLLAERYGSAGFGRISGLLAAAVITARAAAPAVVGAARTGTGTYRTALLGLAALTAVAAAASGWRSGRIVCSRNQRDI